jgi:hypothetical protein
VPERTILVAAAWNRDSAARIPEMPMDMIELMRLD